MATDADQLSTLITMTYDKTKPVLADQITTDHPLLAFLNLKTKITVDGGLTIRRPVLAELNDTVGSFSGYDLFDTTPQDGFGYAEYPWAQHYVSITYSGQEVLQNAGSSQIINLVQAKLDQARLSIEADWSTMFWGTGAGNGAKDFIGLQWIIDNDSTYGNLGGIDNSSEAWWKAVVVATADMTTLAGVQSLNNMTNTLKVGKSKADLELTDQANYEAYEALSVDAVRYTNTAMADLGFEALAHKTATVVFDDECPTAAWYFINSDHLELVTHGQRWLDLTDFIRPGNQDAKTAQILSMGNLITDVRRAHGRITSVTV